MPRVEREALVKSCEEVIGGILMWLAAGCPIDWDLIRQEQKEPRPKTKEPQPVFEADPIAMLGEAVFSADEDVSVADGSEYPESFWRADLKAIAGSGQWVQFVKFLVERGFPVEDKFEKVISPLALWFGFVELFGEDRDRIKQVIHQFVLTRHNGKVTRLLAGKDAEVLSHVDRIVDRVLDGEDDSGKEMFALLRQNRASGKYKQVYRFEPAIMGTEEVSFSSTQQEQENKFYLICRGLIDGNSDSEWKYDPDLKPLPDCVLNQIWDAFKRNRSHPGCQNGLSTDGVIDDASGHEQEANADHDSTGTGGRDDAGGAGVC